MVKYLDTGEGDVNQFVGSWLEQNILGGLRGFRCQFGYFRFEAIAPFADMIRAAGQAGYPIHLVLGSNDGSLIAADVQRALRIVDGENTSLTVVAFSGAEFHPKTVHLIRADGSTCAIVGSSNCTKNGFGLNVEASIALDTLEQDDSALLHGIAAAVDRWRGLEQNGIFHIETDADIQALADSSIINLPQPSRPTMPSSTRPQRGRGLGRRTRMWTPRHGTEPRIPALIPPPLAPSAGAVPTSAMAAPSSAAITARWCKRLRSSDAQQVRGRTNPTGKLRLTESGFGIPHTIWFRQVFFVGVPWTIEIRQGRVYEVARVPVEVKVRGRRWGMRTFIVDHAAHRIASQSNVPTVLAWGSDLLRELQQTNHINDWVVLTRDVHGHFSLAIQQHRPHWAP